MDINSKPIPDNLLKFMETKLNVDEAIRLYVEENLTIRKIADRLGFHRTTVGYHIKKRIKLKEARSYYSKFKNTKQVKMYKDYIEEERLREARKNDAIYKAKTRAMKQPVDFI